MLSTLCYKSMDGIMYTMMNYVQWQLRHEVTTQTKLEAYLHECLSWNRASYFAVTPMKQLQWKKNALSWTSPLSSPFVENNRAHALYFPASPKQAARHPTLIILHALMSASDRGYRRIATHMNSRGWNVLFPHLPFHYTRTPLHHANGALAITADLIRNAETVRQAVQEIRQLIAWSRNQGSSSMGLLATSYGGWVASILLSLEPIDVAILLQPIIDLNVAAFESPLARVMGSLLRNNGITADHLHRHAHLTGPFGSRPFPSPNRIAVIGGKHDLIAPPSQLQRFSSHWGASYHEVEQGHFGYKAMKQALITMDRLTTETIGATMLS